MERSFITIEGPLASKIVYDKGMSDNLEIIIGEEKCIGKAKMFKEETKTEGAKLVVQIK